MPISGRSVGPFLPARCIMLRPLSYVCFCNQYAAEERLPVRTYLSLINAGTVKYFMQGGNSMIAGLSLFEAILVYRSLFVDLKN
jgi:hypothetical protein